MLKIQSTIYPEGKVPKDFLNWRRNLILKTSSIPVLKKANAMLKGVQFVPSFKDREDVLYKKIHNLTMDHNGNNVVTITYKRFF